jgi:hypothetical protein
MEIQNIGVSWYRKDDYDVLRGLFEDGHNLPLTYEAWEQQANAFSSRMASRGVVIIKAYIEPKTFPAWCQSRGLNIDAKARQQFATEFARKYY